jgi:hypothetical protein
MIGLSMINAEHGRMLLQWERFVSDCDHNAKIHETSQVADSKALA